MGILLKPEHKEFEVDPVIDQCWGCGQLNPNHSSNDYNCPRRCIKCGRSGHQFFECSIPKVKENMSEVHKWSRYCIPCDTQGDHTSIDHAACPTKREILRKRVREARANKEAETQAKQRNLDLITQVFDYTNTEIWPHIQSNPQQLKISTLVTLALVDEAVNPGVFQEKLARYSELNNLPKVRYRLQPNTAKVFFNTLVGVGDQSAPRTHTLTKGKLSAGGNRKISLKTSRRKLSGGHKNFSLKSSRRSRDILGGKRALQTLENEPEDTNWNTSEKEVQKTEDKSRTIKPSTKAPSNKEKISKQTLHCWNQLRTELEDTNLKIQGIGNENSMVKESMIKIGILNDMLQIYKLGNEKSWVDTIKRKLKYLISEGLQEHYVPYKSQILSQKHLMACSPQVTSSNIIETLKEVSMGKKLEDWDLSTEDLRNLITDPDELNQYDYYDSDDFTLSSGEHTRLLEEYIYSEPMEHLYITPSILQS